MHYFTTIKAWENKGVKIPYHYEGMVEQLICASSNLFIGTRLSTFSSYVPRMRGYSIGLEHKEVFFADRKYTGDEERDGNEKHEDTTNMMIGGGAPKIVFLVL